MKSLPEIKVSNARKPEKRRPWACPKCGATHVDAGHKCERKCDGLCCDYAAKPPCPLADAERDDHGEVESNPCTSARCYHCGWKGEMPSGTARSKPARKPAPKKPALALDPATLRWCAGEAERWAMDPISRRQCDAVLVAPFARRLRARAARIERSRKS